MGCCAQQSYTHSYNQFQQFNWILHYQLQQNFEVQLKSCLRERKIEPIQISIIGDSDGMEIMDDGLHIQLTSIKEIQSPNVIKFPSESVVIDLRSGTSLASPTRRISSKNLNQKFIEML